MEDYSLALKKVAKFPKAFPEHHGNEEKAGKCRRSLRDGGAKWNMEDTNNILCNYLLSYITFLPTHDAFSWNKSIRFIAYYYFSRLQLNLL